MSDEENDNARRARAKAQDLFSDGLYCGESVIAAVNDVLELDTGLKPAMATCFCSGLGRTGGMCGALSGAAMTISAVEGRDGPDGDIAGAYEAVQMLVDEFEESFGTTNCTELLGCHLGTPEGQHTFTEQNLIRRCRDYSGRAAELATEILTMRTRARVR